MNDKGGWLLVGLAFCSIFWPWAVGIVDLWAWMLAGSQVTSIPWGAARGGLLIMWPFFGAFIVAGLLFFLHGLG